MKIIKRAALALMLALLFALPSYAYADTNASEPSAVETTTSDELAASTTIPEQETPLSIRPYETGWSLINLLASLLTVIIGIGLVVVSTIRRNDDDGSPNNFGLTVFSMTAAVMATILFTSTADIQTQMIAVDSFTAVHVVVLAVAILCAVLSTKKSVGVSSIQL
jgi:hypothetical protein